MPMLYALIMAGGAGTRFWPASRAARPKQLLDLTGDRTMIQATVDRLAGLVPSERIMILTGRPLVAAIAEQLPQVPRAAILGEPCRRDTAPCVGLAALMIAQRDPRATMVVMPADHVIRDTAGFQAAIQDAARMVEGDPRRLVTFGIKPTYAAETFGYIEPAEPADATASSSAYHVRRFHEKPRGLAARRYFESGSCYWNSGIFVWKAATIAAAIQRLEPAMYGHLAAIATAADTPEFAAVLDREFAAIEGRSIDYAVMERYEHVSMIAASFDWDDVGSWQSLARLHRPDAHGNTVVGKHLGIRTSGSIIRTEAQHLVVTVGLTDCLVVHTPNATLVANKHDEEAIREVVKHLQENGWDEYL
jgi:mannose-1-phosphate guanylyltransferase